MVKITDKIFVRLYDLDIYGTHTYTLYGLHIVKNWLKKELRLGNKI
jgi:hypothetical protein